MQAGEDKTAYNGILRTKNNFSLLYEACGAEPRALVGGYESRNMGFRMLEISKIGFYPGGGGVLTVLWARLVGGGVGS